MDHKLIAPLLLLAVLIVDILTDGLAKRDVLTGKWSVNHTRGLIWRIPGFVAATWIYPLSVILWVPWWPAFDIGVSLLRGLPWDFVGTTGWLDKLQRKYPQLQNAKYALGITAIVAYLLL